MVKEKTTTGRVGRFLYNFPSEGKVSIAYRTLMDSSISQKVIEFQLKGILGPTLSFDKVVFEGFAYPGIVYNFSNMSEGQLRELLSRRT